jgi:hypothetical protein
LHTICCILACCMRAVLRTAVLPWPMCTAVVMLACVLVCTTSMWTHPMQRLAVLGGLMVHTRRKVVLSCSGGACLPPWAVGTCPAGAPAADGVARKHQACAAWCGAVACLEGCSPFGLQVLGIRMQGVAVTHPGGSYMYKACTVHMVAPVLCCQRRKGSAKGVQLAAEVHRHRSLHGLSRWQDVASRVVCQAVLVGCLLQIGAGTALLHMADSSVCSCVHTTW